jgi:uncharacterized membrane protein YgaE (UPF0421/DUF939 family)
MNKTAITLSIVALVAIMFVGIIVIAAFKPEALTTLIPFVGTTLATLVSTVVIFYGLGKTNEKVDKIEHNTNGINSALLASALERSEDTIERWKNPEKEESNG